MEAIQQSRLALESPETTENFRGWTLEGLIKDKYPELWKSINNHFFRCRIIEEKGTKTLTMWSTSATETTDHAEIINQLKSILPEGITINTVFNKKCCTDRCWSCLLDTREKDFRTEEHGRTYLISQSNT